MRRALRHVVTLLALGIVSHTVSLQAQTPAPKLIPFDFRGHHLGDPRWEDIGLSCTPISSETGRNEQTCQDYDDRIGATSAKIYYHFIDNALTEVMLTYAPANYEEIRAAFTQKFGKPYLSREWKVQNRMGATFINSEGIWPTASGSFRVARYGASLDEGEAFILSAKEEAVQRRRVEEARKHPNN